MRRTWLILSLLACCPAAHAAEAPFAPLPNVPDYVAIFAVKSGWGRPRVNVDIVMHHGDWTRIDSISDGHELATYFGPGPISIDFRRDAAGAYRTLGITRGIRDYGSIWDYRSFKTADQDDVLGQRCDVWNGARMSLGRVHDKESKIERFSCITSDGIELWRKHISSSSGESSFSFRATSLARTPVSSSAVQPPVDLLDLASWLPKEDVTASPPPRTPGDVTVMMESEPKTEDGRPFHTRIVRRHHPWSYVEDTWHTGSRRITVTNEATRRTILFESGTTGEPTRLSIYNDPPPSREVDLKGPRLLDKREVVLDELCEWFDMWPNMSDHSLHQCRTRDGVALKEKEFSGPHTVPLIALRIDRAPVNLTEILLPLRDVFSRSVWGIPD